MISSYSLSAGEGQQVGVGGAAQTIATAAARYQHPPPTGFTVHDSDVLQPLLNETSSRN